MDKVEHNRNRKIEAKDSLVNNRFKLSRDAEQRERIRKIREIVNDFSVNHPEFVSLQIFGSLVKGYGVSESDLDAFLILDEDKMNEIKEKYQGAKPKNTKDIIERITAQEKPWLELKAKIMEGLNFSKERVNDILFGTISKDYIRESLVQVPRNLAFMFFPSIGATKIREYRKIIFDELRDKGEQGERVWRSIMEELCFLERGGGLDGVKSKQLYPQTLAEGEKRFL